MSVEISEKPYAPHYEPAPPSQADVKYAELPKIDLSFMDNPEGRRVLSDILRHAMDEFGFFYVVNHGLTPEQTERMFDVADVPFAQVKEEEKKRYEGTMKVTGSYQGYKMRQYWHIHNGVQDQLEHYNINRDVTKREHPEAVRPFLPEIAAFARHNHFNVLHPLLKLFALGMNLHEDTFVNIHGFDAVGESYVRFMKYYPRSEEEETKTDGVWLKGHTDFGTLTILYSQPVTSLQIQSQKGNWFFVKHIPNALVVNAGDAMEKLSGGMYKGTIHRVICPPDDQRGYTRVGVFYFATCDDNVVLRPIDGSDPNAEAPTMEEWRKARTSAYGQSELTKGEGGVETEMIAGEVVKHYS